MYHKDVVSIEEDALADTVLADAESDVDVGGSAAGVNGSGQRKTSKERMEENYNGWNSKCASVRNQWLGCRWLNHKGRLEERGQQLQARQARMCGDWMFHSCICPDSATAGCCSKDTLRLRMGQGWRPAEQAAAEAATPDSPAAPDSSTTTFHSLRQVTFMSHPNRGLLYQSIWSCSSCGFFSASSARWLLA
jgi:hypothetical protein